jgi:glycosyltransferase involved in cell wall biosynthesis
MRIVIDLQGAQSASRFRGIGRYSLALALGVARNAGEHEIWLVLNGGLPDAISSVRAAFAGLVPNDRIRVFDLPAPSAEADQNNQVRTRAAERIREYFIAQLEPDAVLITSLFEGYIDDTVASVGSFASGADTAVVLYDLIPLLNPENYLPTEQVRDYYNRKVDSLRRAGLLLAISDYSRQEAIDALDLDPATVVAISTAVDERFQPATCNAERLAALREQFGIARELVMYAPGGCDSRKNIDGLIKAFSLLEPGVRAAHQLLIVSKLDLGQLKRLQQHALDCGLEADEVLFSGYVVDDDLVDLYRFARLFVFPSLHEGFGLPALEAMACGCAVIGANNTSIPEVIGNEAAMFDAADPQAIADKISAVLADETMLQQLRSHGVQQAARFSWDVTASRALRALEAHAARKAALPPAAPRRKRLAFVSPLPPERTGIADYSAQCLPALAELFDIDLIVHQDKVVLPASLDALPRRDVRWFAENAGEFDQILYQFGNSPFHSHMFGLLKRFPGVVVLHDFFLSSVLYYEQMTGGIPNAWTDALHYSHGAAALQAAQEPGNVEAARQVWPCNLAVIQGATGVIVHSDHALQLARQWYGQQAGSNWHVVPLPRSAPGAIERAAARAALGIPMDAFLVCTFGFIDPTKQSHRLLDAWNTSVLAQDPACHLVFVGANHGGDYGVTMSSVIAGSPGAKRIKIAGWTDEQVYRQYLQAADVGVQLRTMSRGETSAAVLDCLNYGLATVVNANGSMAALPSNAVWKLADNFDNADLTTALEGLHRDAGVRAALSARANALMEQQHRPHHAAALYAQALDHTDGSASTRMPALLESLAAVPGMASDDEALRQLAQILALAPQHRPQPPQLLVDVTNIVRNDLGTGIERVVRMQLQALMRRPAGGYRTEPVYLSKQDGQWIYRYARQYARKVLGMSPNGDVDEPVDINHNDLFYAPDYAPGPTIEAANAGIYAHWRARGVSVNFLIHDLLPVLRPEFFPTGADVNHAAWLDCIAAQGDRLVCISAAVADEAQRWLAARPGNDGRQFKLPVVHHGADIDAAGHTRPAPAPASHAVLADIKARPTFLMVGTIEPRKGHLQAIEAFDQLWRDGVEANLVIVGSEGWKPLAASERRTIPAIVDRLTSHPQREQRLFWLQGIDDALLQQIYQDSACLLAASEGEGFGLPLIEAARYDLAVIARDIPVFREVAKEQAFYFDGASGADLAGAIARWLDLYATRSHPQSGQMRWHTWQHNAEHLLAALKS